MYDFTTAVALVGVLLLRAPLPINGFGFGSNLGCGITDEYGCCTSSGFFWCGSSGRCSYGGDVCEDGLGFAMPCTFTDFLTGVSFDLSPLKHTTSSLDHVVVDSSSTQGHTTTYIFNVCANAVTPDACASSVGGAGETLTGPAPAYQLYSDKPASSFSSSSSSVDPMAATSGKYGGDKSSACFRMGGSVQAATTLTVGSDSGDTAPSSSTTTSSSSSEGDDADAYYSMGLYDSAIPAKGVYIRYSQGNSCDASSSKKKSSSTVDSHNGGTCNAATFEVDGQRHCTRSLQINFLCHNTIREVPPEAVVSKITTGRMVDPSDTCAHEITLDSVYGCPSECPVAFSVEYPLGAVCADHGRCYYGAYRGSHCVCSEGWSGVDCATSTLVAPISEEDDDDASSADSSAVPKNGEGASRNGRDDDDDDFDETDTVQRNPFESDKDSSSSSSSQSSSSSSSVEDSLQTSNRHLLSSLWWVLPVALFAAGALLSFRTFLKWRNGNRGYGQVPTFEDFELIAGGSNSNGGSGSGGGVSPSLHSGVKSNSSSRGVERGGGGRGGRGGDGNPFEGDDDDIGSGIF